MRLHLLLAGTASAALMTASPALAQTGGGQGTGAQETESNQEIVVTATKRASTVQDVPFSINAQTQEDIQRSGATTIEDLSRNVAGLTVQNLGPGQSQVAIRGVSAGQIVRDQPGVKEQVGVYLDESVISLSLFTPDIDLFDLNRVETLRGPQGTLFGSGSVGGTIRYITNQPRTDRVEGLVEANLNLVDGNDLGGHLKGAVNLPLGSGAAVRVVGYHTEYGGFVDALREGGEIDRDINDGHRTGGRISLLLEPTENITITPRLLYQEIEANGFNRQDVYNLYANPFNTTRPRVTFRERQQFLLLDEQFKDETLIADLVASVGFGGVELTSVTSYIDRDILVSRDASALTGSVSVDLGFPAAGVLLPSNLRDTTALETFTQELRLASTGSGPFQWVIGGFYSDVERVYQQRLPTPGYDAFTDQVLGSGTSAAVRNGFDVVDSPFNSDLPYDIEQKSVFGEASYDFGRLTATAGLRYYDFEEVRDIAFGGLFADATRRVGETTKSNGLNPRFLLSYEASDRVTINAQAAKGFRLGGVNDPLNLPLCTAEDRATFEPFEGAFQDETLWNYELGVKSQFRGITFNAAAFYTEIEDLQVTLDAGTCSSRIVFNVPKAHTQGLEFELSAEPVDNLDLSISGSILEAEFDSTLTSGGNVIGGIREGNRLPSVPKFQISASASYSVPIDTSGTEASFTASFQHVGSRFTQPGDQENNPRTFVHGLPFGGQPAGSATTLDLKLPDYQLVNLSAGISFPNELEVIAYITNVFDENPILSFDRERGGRARLGFQIGQPRTFGVTARKRF
jgi:outer membrane receptor protein involved in Fe transport